jgi:23S rRNA (adenine2503-C2)-methyltransferase
MNETKTSLLGSTFTEIEALVLKTGLPKYSATQISDWVYKKHAASFDEMSNLSKATRESLSKRCEIGRQAPVKFSESADLTRKYLYSAANQGFVEAAWIPDKDRATLCISSQVGCKMGCLFCMTGKQGFQAQLSASEILNQYASLPERDRVTNIVYMGMGEPFDNLKEVMRSIEIFTAPWGYAMSPRRITVSTIGLLPAMKEFIEQSQAHLAISLHSPFEDERKYLMPIQNVFSISEVTKLLRSYDLGRQRRISFEYIMFKGLNDSQRHVKELARLLNGIRCRVNLIRFHEIPGVPLQCSEDDAMVSFRDALKAKGIITTIRQSRGQDIEAACGLLSTKELVKRQQDY